MSIIVLCGLGRRMALQFPQAPDANWRIEVVPSFDFDTLCWIPEFDALSLLRLAEARNRMESEGVCLLNSSGLLNLVAWMRQHKGHLVPHASIPAEFASGDGPRAIGIETNAYRLLRHDVLTTFDARRVLDIDGRWMPARREARSLFKEERNTPLYFSEDGLREGRLRAVYVTKTRPYWIECIWPDGADRHSAFQHFEMAYTWLRRVAPMIDSVMTGLSEGPVEFRLFFAAIEGERWTANFKRSERDLRALIHTTSAMGSLTFTSIRDTIRA